MELNCTKSPLNSFGSDCAPIPLLIRFNFSEHALIPSSAKGYKSFIASFAVAAFAIAAFAVGAFHYLLLSPHLGYPKRNSATRACFVVYFALFSPPRMSALMLIRHARTKSRH